MKKRLFVLFFVLLLTTSLAFAQLPEGFGENEDGKLVDGDGNEVSPGLVQEREGQDRQFSWDSFYEAMLKNENIAAVDNVFRNNDLVFRVLFGVPYQFNGTMLLIFILWFCTLMFLPDLVDSIDFFNKITSWIVALLIVIILAQAQFFRVIVNVSERVFFFSENQWVRFVLFFMLVFLYVIFYYIGKTIGDYFEKARKAKEDKELKESTVAVNKDRLKGQKKGADYSKKMIDGMSSSGRKK